MPAPAVYVVGAISVVAVAIAFKAFVYEPHIAPRLEAWAESYIDGRRRRRQQQHGPIPARPHLGLDQGDENEARRSDDFSDGDGAHMPVELRQFSSQVRDSRRDGANSGLTRRPNARPPTMDQSNAYLPYSPISPMHVLSDSSVPSSPTSTSLGSNSPAPTAAAPVSAASSSLGRLPLSERPRTSQSNSFTVSSPRLPTPMSMQSVASPHAVTPNTMGARSPTFSASRASTPDVPALYSTALGSIEHLSDRGSQARIDSMQSSRVQSPFSDIFSVGASSPTLRSPREIGSPDMHFSESELDMHSDWDDDVMSLRSGMFSPGSGAREELLFDVASVHGSEASSWASVGRRTPDL